MIEKGLNQHNFMPGTERYTRPEEVKALNKFLKSVKEIQEEHTEVSEDNLALPGSPKIPEVDLDSRRVDVNGVLSQVDKLVEGRLNINPGNDIKSLEDAKVNIEDTRENTLETTRETITSKEQSSLEDTRVDISEGNDPEMENKRLDLETTQIESLEESILGITNDFTPELNTTTENIPTKGEGLQVGNISKLSEEKQILGTSGEENSSGNQELSETKLEIQDNTGVANLENEKISISDKKTTKLESEILEITDKTQPRKLEDTKETILGKEIKSLETTKETITPGKDKTLETTKLEIQENSIESLSDDKLEIQENTVNSLETNKETITKNDLGELETESIKIQENSIDSLSETKLTINSEEVDSLETEILGFQASGVDSLGDVKEEIQENSIESLSDDKLEIQENTVNSLETNKETITKNDLGELETESIKIQENSIDSLEDTVKTLGDIEDQELSGTKLDIQENSVDSLSDDIKTINSSEVENLDETRKDIQENQVDSLSTTRQDLAPKDNTNLETKKSELQVDSKVEDLESKIIEGPGENGVSELENLVSGLSVNSKVSDLSTSRIDINPAQDNSLSENLKELGVEEKISDLENSLGGLDIEEKVDSLSEVIIEGPGIDERDLDTSVIDLDKGEEKINSLDTTIIDGPTSDNPENLETSVLTIDSSEDRDLETTAISLQSGEDQSLEDFIDMISPGENQNLDDTSISLSGVSDLGSLMKDVIDNPSNSGLGDRTYTDGSYSLSEVELKTAKQQIHDNKNPKELGDNKLDLTDTREELEELDDPRIQRPEDPGVNERTIRGKYKQSKVELKYNTIELKDTTENIEDLEDTTYIEDLPEGYSLKNRTVLDLNDTVKDPEYAIKYVENVSKKGDTSSIKTPSGYTTENRTITDLDLTVKDPKYTIESNSSLGKSKINIPEGYSIDDRSSNTKDYSVFKIDSKEDLKDYRDSTEVKTPRNAEISDRTLYSLNEKYEFIEGNSEYTLAEKRISTKKDTSDIKTPGNQSSKQVTSIDDIGELHTTDKYKNGQSGDHGYLTPGYKLPEIGWKNFWDGGALSPSTYLRWATENTVGKIPLKGAMKGKLIDETLALLVIAREKLEKVTKGNRDRLPGGDMSLLSSLANGSLSVKSAAKSVLGAVGKALSTSKVDKSNPINRPDPKNAQLSSFWEAPGQNILDGSIKISDNTSGFFNKVGTSLFGGDYISPGGFRRFKDMIDSSFFSLDSNNSPIGIGATMTELINDKKLTHYSLTQFKDALKHSRYITTPDKFTTTSDSTNYMTLDSNHIWEIIFKPYLGKLNGNKTWLPSFYEIDKQNKYSFNMTTHHSSGWLPITGFELQDKKLTSKDLPLFNGSISYPTGLEFTNELRLTFADDSLKSLKRYFDLCTKVSAYMSNIHTEGEPGYLFPEDDLSIDIDNPTVYIDGKVHPGLYKNLSFIVTIFILTPQYGTIKKCDLLCVIKDYSLDNQGETDSSPTELNVTFSIVGENPLDLDEKNEQRQTNSYTPPDKTGNTDRTGTGILDNLGSLVNIF